ncbi:ABC transporter ATP-binding protein, partial [Patescibacteria group bacterium]|nr:ABC transporter ATP-binding protein [Patescibacteria group bacterium]
MSEQKPTTRPQVAQSPMRGFGPGGGNVARMMQAGEKAKDFKGTMKSLIRYMRPFRYWILAVVIFAIASTTFSIISPKLLGHMT